jgi:sterol 14-demethylase
VSGTWRIAVDEDLCQGHGVCESEAPEVFEVTRDRKVAVMIPEPDDTLRRQVDAAVRYCPTHALRIVEGPSEEN